MSIRTLLTAWIMCLAVVGTAVANDLPNYTRDGLILYGGSAALSKASGDTIDLMGPTGSGAPYIGDFEGGWNGWVSSDETQPMITHWQVSDYNQAVAGNLAAWCGDLSIPSCSDSLDVAGGYGNSWHDLLVFRATVSNPSLGAAVAINATLQIDSEPGYDYTYLSINVERSLGYIDIRSWDGQTNVVIAENFNYLPADLLGGTDVEILFRFQSDGGWSDVDCAWPTAGACQIDNISTTISQVGEANLATFTDFQDGTFGAWSVDFPTGVGNFSKLWNGLADLDPCGANYSQQVAFIDDGIVVPGTGGSDCLNWCYGPSGYIVNTTGGLAGPAYHLSNDLFSPVMNWPNDIYDGIIVAFDVYRHEDLSADAPGVFYTWDVRSADTDGSAGNGVQTLYGQNYFGRSFVYYGGPDYVRPVNDVTDLMNPGRDEIQIKLSVVEMGWAWGWMGNDGYPAPYFDNVSVKVFPYVGPGMSTREIDIANDNFPEVDEINFADLGSMHVRFDMARNISLAAHLRNDPGDSIVFRISPVRSGATLAGSPEMHYTIDANPVFNAFRTTPTSGMVLGIPAVGASGIPSPDQWAFDLPDTGTLYPGDVLHYYIRAGDEVGGDIQWATMPADISGFGDFGAPQAYETSYVVHALPTINSDGFESYQTPRILFWNDFANRGGEAEWYNTLRNLALVSGVDYDIYYTNGPSSGVGNGLGGRTSGLALEHYSELLYSAGDLSINTISNGDYNNDAGNDIGALLNWLSFGDKNMFITGDNVASDLAQGAGDIGVSFFENVMGLDMVSFDVRSLIGNQTTPLVMDVVCPIESDVFVSTGSWIAFGGCRGINTFDAVTARTGAVRQAEFTDPNGLPGSYTFAAANLNVYSTTNRIVSMPYDLMSIYTDANAKVSAPMPARTMIMADLMDFFGYANPGLPSSVPPVRNFAVSNAPNPFNPSTKISYTIKAAGHLVLKVYNVRGELVKTLIDGHVEQNDFVMWDGTSNQGSSVPSGVYFYEARMGTEVKVSKMALVK